MSISLYDQSVVAFNQVLDSVAALLEKGRQHMEQESRSADELVELRIHEDMLPLQFQIVSVAHHSLGAIQGIQAGRFAPPPPQEKMSYAALQSLVADTKAELDTYTADVINALEGEKLVFEFGDTRIPFTAENFIGSFSLPNFYFHAATAYDILRMEGVALGKRDFLGQLRIDSSE